MVDKAGVVRTLRRSLPPPRLELHGKELTSLFVEVLSAGSIWQERGWREALKRLRDQLESDAPEGDRIAVAGGNRYATGIP